MRLLLWLVVVNQLDPVTNQTIYNVPITIENEDYFTERNQYVTVDSELSVNVTVNGRRSVVEKLTADDFTATVDYMEVEPSAGRGQVPLCQHESQCDHSRPESILHTTHGRGYGE